MTICKECDYYSMSTFCNHESNLEPDYVDGGYIYKETPSRKNPLGECEFFESKPKSIWKKLMKWIGK